MAETLSELEAQAQAQSAPDQESVPAPSSELIDAEGAIDAMSRSTLDALASVRRLADGLEATILKDMAASKARVRATQQIATSSAGLVAELGKGLDAIAQTYIDATKRADIAARGAEA